MAERLRSEDYGLMGDLSGLENPELKQLIQERREYEPQPSSNLPWIVGAAALGAAAGKLGWSIGRRWSLRHAH